MENGNAASQTEACRQWKCPDAGIAAWKRRTLQNG